MRKLSALILAVMMVFSATVAGAETFNDNLDAFMTNLMKLDEHDAALTASMDGGTYVLQIGKNDQGLNADLAMSMEDTKYSVGSLMVAQDAAYLEMMGSTMAVKYDVLSSLTGASGEAAEGETGNPLAGLDFEALSMGASTALSYGMSFLQEAMGTLKGEEIEGGTHFTVDTAALATVVDNTVSTILQDESVKQMWESLAPVMGMNGMNMSFEDLAAQWEENKAGVLSAIQNLNGYLNVMEDGSMEGLVQFGGEQNVEMAFNMAQGENGFEFNATLAQSGQDPAVKLHAAIGPDTLNVQAEAPNATMNLNAQMQDGAVASLEFTASSEGSDFSLTYSGNKITVAAADTTVELELVEMTETKAVCSIKIQNGENVQEGTVTAELHEDSLDVVLDLGGNAITATVSAVEKGEYKDLSQNEDIMWITPEMMMQMAGSVSVPAE